MVEELKKEKDNLEKNNSELKLKYEHAERRAAELREAEAKKHTEEIQFLKKTNQQLKVIDFSSTNYPDHYFTFVF